MAERFKDNEDRMLESIFRSAPVADGGFSDRVIATIRRRIWVRRLALPVAMVVGGAVAIRPLLGLAQAMAGLLETMPVKVPALEVVPLPPLPTLLLGAGLLAAGLLVARLAED